MKNSKLSRFFGRGRKWVFTHAPKSQTIWKWLLVRGTALALFLLVFALSSVMKIHAGTSDSGSGWLWGGGAGSNDGTNTNVGWISINNTNQNGATNYGVNIPSGNGDVTGYAWSENIGWISFNAADTASCPQNPCGAVRVVGNNIKGWARILGIKTEFEKVPSNSGGWQGWVSLSGPQYGVKINQDNTLTGFGWSDELGWIDFSRASMCASPKTSTVASQCSGYSLGTTGSSCSSTTYCSGDTSSICKITSATTWTCTNSCGESVSGAVPPLAKTDGKCGTADGTTICNVGTPQWCAPGSTLIGTPSDDSYETTWQCGGTCGGTIDDCSAKGKKSCGWIETNP